MMLYKVTRPNGESFHDPSFVYEKGKTLRRRVTVGDPKLCSPTVLHASRTPEQAATFGRWPYVLWEVQGIPVVEDPDKVGCKQLTVVKKLPTHRCFGPQGKAVLRVIQRAETITPDEAQRLAAAWDAAWNAAGYAAWDAAWNAAGYAAWYAAWNAAGYAAWNAARYAAVATTVADLVGQHGPTQEHIDTLRKPWLDVIGPTWEDE